MQVIACWLESRNFLVLGSNVIQEATKKVAMIKKRMKAIQDRQKSYADRMRRDLEFDVGDLVFIDISPIRGVVRFGKAGKLAPRYIEHFRILKRIRSLTYKVELPKRLAGVHSVFYVSHLRKFVHDLTLILEPSEQKDVEVEPDLTLVKHPVYIVDQDKKRLRNKVVQLVNIQWSEDPRKLQVGDCRPYEEGLL